MELSNLKFESSPDRSRYQKASPHWSAEAKKKMQDKFRLALFKKQEAQWRVKWCSSKMKFYAHLHNFDIEKGMPYFDKMKEMSYDGVEVNETLCNVHDDYSIVYEYEDGTIKKLKKQHAYKTFCDGIMIAIQNAEGCLRDCKKFIVAMEVIEAKKNMITRKKKGKH